MAKVSIIIPFYNCPYIGQAISSALNQTYKDIEVIVVNDGSTMHVDKVMPYISRIKYIAKGNGGTASALNTGIRNAAGQYFAWLSSDDVYHPRKIEKQVQQMISSGAMVSYTNYYLINERGQVISQPAGVYYSSFVQFAKRMRRGCIINGCTVMLNMNVFKEFGLFDESLPYTHDYDYWLRIMKKHQFHYLVEPLLNYRVHSEMGTKKHGDKIKQEIRTTIRRHRGELNNLINLELRRRNA
ncbi:glycosyltransferase family 2 protein [Fictibacillus iocasae]|uniref:Glycosyltransferase family 2 protein n=1 Tax=Fictibacillus iocasae TaxID=2715437 RepID=A0ABW2NRL9_9BACL